MTKWLAMLMACLALGLVVAGCGDDDEDESGGGGADTSEPAPADDTAKEEEPAAGGKTVEVAMKDIAFDPEEVTVNAGSKVKWTNEDTVGHDVTKTGGPGPEFSSGDPGGMQEGDTFEATLTAPGTVEYVCTVHPNMKGSIVVN
jgi:plastocyanin